MSLAGSQFLRISVGVVNGNHVRSPCATFDSSKKNELLRIFKPVSRKFMYFEWRLPNLTPTIRRVNVHDQRNILNAPNWEI